MDNTAISRLQSGAIELGIEISPEAAAQLHRFATELLKWNKKINLTSLRTEDEVLERHLLDSIAVALELRDAESVLDVGSGAGLPGIPLKIVKPSLDVTSVDSVGKKVGFQKHVLAMLQLGTGIRVRHVRLAGNAKEEGLVPVDVVMSRATANLVRWLELGRSYLKPHGQLIAMLGPASNGAELEKLCVEGSWASVRTRTYELPFSRIQRRLAVFSL